MTKQEIAEVGLKLLTNAKKYDGEKENKPTPELFNLLNRTGRLWAMEGSGRGIAGAFNIQTDGWCSDFVAGNNHETGFEDIHVGRASGWKDFGYLIWKEGDPEPEDPSILQTPGIIIVFETHVAYRDDKPDHIFGGNQSDGVCSQHQKYYGIPIAYVIPMPPVIKETPITNAQPDKEKQNELAENTKKSLTLQVDANTIFSNILRELQEQGNTLKELAEIIKGKTEEEPTEKSNSRFQRKS